MDADGYSLRLPVELAPLLHEDAARVDGDELLTRVWLDTMPELARLARALGLAHEAEDVLHDVYLVAREKRPAAATDEQLRKWLFRVTANACRLAQRRRGRWSRVIGALGWSRSREDTTTSATPLEQAELTTNVEAALARLSAHEREIVVLRYFAKFDSREIGELLAMPDATVRSHLAKARRKLAKSLADWSDE